MVRKLLPKSSKANPDRKYKRYRSVGRLIQWFGCVWLGSAFLVLCKANFLSAADNPQLDRPQQKEKLELQQKLQKYGLATDRASIQNFLQDLNDPNPDWSKAKKWIKQLGSKSYSERAEANRSLDAMVPIPVRLLQQASTSSDPEIVFRTTNLLKVSIEKTESLVGDVLRAIKTFEIENLCREILATGCRFSSNQNIIPLVRKALFATATKNDIPVLRVQMDVSKPIVIRKMSIKILRKLKSPELSQQFSQWFHNKDFTDLPRLECVLALADVGDRRAVNYLKELMENGKTVSIRACSKIALKELTGQNFAYSVSANLNTRRKQIVAWETWIEANRATAKLYFPLRKSISIEFDECFLVSICKDQGKVMLLDESLDEVWSIRCGFPGNAEKMENGNILVGCRNRIFEITLDKEIVREHKFKTKTSDAVAQPLANGNVLVAINKRVVELESNGKTIWELNTILPVNSVVCRANGNVIVSSFRSETITFFLEEYDRSKELLWRMHAHGPSRFDRLHLLPNGNILFTGLGEFGEIDCKTREIIARRKIPTVDSFRLANGNTILFQGYRGPNKDQAWFTEIDSDGNLVRSKFLGKGISGSVRQ